MRLSKRGAPIAMLAAAVAMLTACKGESPMTPGGDGTPPKAIPVAFAGGTLSAELATRSAQRTTGLMNRNAIAADSGMLFVWAADQNPQFAAFHMVNTHFDLDIAFIGAGKQVINIEAMTKETSTLHFAAAAYRYALEAPKGWFAARGVVAGATVSFAIPAGVLVDP